MLVRVRLSGATLAAAALGLLLLAPAPVQAKSAEAARGAALAWLEAAAEEPTPFAAHFAEAVAANGLDPATWPGPLPVAAKVAVPGPEASPIQLLRPLRALALAGDARAALDGNLTLRVLATHDGHQFGSPTALNDDAYAILALLAAGVPRDDPRLVASADVLQSEQQADGGWGWSVGANSGTDMTGLVATALVALGGADAPSLQQARHFVATTQTGPGHAETPGGPANCESTAWALRVQGLAGERPDAQAWGFLLSLQNPDGGFAHRPGGASDPLCTAEATTVLGLAHSGQLPLEAMDGASTPNLGLVPATLVLATLAMATSTRLRLT